MGNAKAFAGNNVDGASVKYRVVRNVQYPVWWGWRNPYRGNAEMEITNGSIETDAKGEFKIVFKAIPDETVEKNSQPTFTYQISADVTDVNGETHSGNTNVSVKYQAISLSISAPEKLDADSLHNIKIKSANTNGKFEKATVDLKVEKLASNTKIYRSRYWQKPDQFVLSAEEFHKYFPYDEYNDESNMQTWAIEKTYPTISAETQKDGSFDLQGLNLSEGWYKFTATTKDKYGEEVKDIKNIQLTGNKTNITEPLIAAENKESYQPGEKILYEYQTGFNNIWVIEEIKKTEGESKFNVVNVSENQPYKNSILVSESDRGGMFRSPGICAAQPSLHR